MIWGELSDKDLIVNSDITITSIFIFYDVYIEDKNFCGTLEDIVGDFKIKIKREDLDVLAFYCNRNDYNTTRDDELTYTGTIDVICPLHAAFQLKIDKLKKPMDVEKQLAKFMAVHGLPCASCNRWVCDRNPCWDGKSHYEGKPRRDFK